MWLRNRKLVVAGSFLLLISVAAPGLASATTGEHRSGGIAAPTTVGERATGPAQRSISKATPTAALDAAGWLGRQFLSNGDLPVSENVAGLNNLSLALAALVSARTGRNQETAGLKYLEEHFESFVSEPVSKTKSVDLPGRLAEVILAALGAGANPARFGGDKAANDLVARLLATQAKSGSNAGLFGSPNSPTYSTAYTEGLALMALAGSGRPNSLGATWLVAQQCANGGWTSYRADTSKACPAENPAKFTGADTNSTGLAVEALVATKRAPRLSPVGFLEKAEYPSGGFGYIGAVAKSQPVDPDSTALVIQALVALGKLGDPSFSKPGGGKPEVALNHFQLGCGAPVGERGAYVFPGESGPNLVATIQAIPAAAEKAYPLGKATLSTSLPRTACPSSTNAGRSAHRAAGSIEKACPSVPKQTSGHVVVPIVVDFGSNVSTIDVTCVAVPTGSSGSDVLAARADVLRAQQPVYNSSGLLCQIDGYPTSGCGAQSGSHYAYWAYFHGGSTWHYADDGPAENSVGAGDVEGWRFEPDGSATSSDPSPRAPSSASILERGPTTTTTTTTTTTSVTTTTPTTRPASHPPTSTTAVSRTRTSTTSRPASHSQAASTTSPSSGGSSKGSSGHSGPSVTAASSHNAAAGTSAGNGAAATAAGSVGGGGTSTEQNGATGLAVAGVSGANRGGSSGSGRDIVLGLAALVIVLGVVFALLHSRRRLGAER